MTRIAVISDIHSNLPALEAVCAELDRLNCQDTFCLGDIVGYGAHPSECLQIVQKRKMICVQGNHDAHISDNSSGSTYGFNYAAIMAVNYNREYLNDAQLTYLRELPVALHWDDRTLLVHGTPDDRDKYLRFDDELRDMASGIYKEHGPGIMFFGHTHVPSAHNGSKPMPVAQDLLLVDMEKRMLFNPGSVGQPRDGDPRAAYMLWDTEKGIITLHRVKYDTNKARASIIACGLPYHLGDRLLRGR